MGGGGEGRDSGGGAASVREAARDFSNVASFSELPFLQRSAAPPRGSPHNSGIRIFGIDVPRSPPERNSNKDATAATTTTATAAASATQSSGGGGGGPTTDSSSSSRKFECHYCCRNFPTSQALGGHQNAHKRERQHAKRVQMQSAMAAAAAAAAAAAGGAHHHHLLGYPQHRFGVAGPTVATLYPSWPTMRAPAGAGAGAGAVAIGGPQFYSGIGSIAQPINGSPLLTAGGLWRAPPPAAGHGNASLPSSPGGERRRPVALSSPVFRGDDPRASTSLLASSSPSSSSSLLLSPQGQFVCEQPATTAAEGVSLDLHL